SQTFSKASSAPLFTLKRFMAMNMVFSSAELANASDSSSQLKTDGHREGHSVACRRRWKRRGSADHRLHFLIETCYSGTVGEPHRDHPSPSINGKSHRGITLIAASARIRGKLLVAREARRDDSPIIRVVVGPPVPDAV